MRSLQWGHDLSVMDTFEETIAKLALTTLQWGHDLSVMDTLVEQIKGGLPYLPSMGP